MYARSLAQRIDGIRKIVVLAPCAIGLCFYASPWLFALAERIS